MWVNFLVSHLLPFVLLLQQVELDRTVWIISTSRVILSVQVSRSNEKHGAVRLFFGSDYRTRGKRAETSQIAWKDKDWNLESFFKWMRLGPGTWWKVTMQSRKRAELSPVSRLCDVIWGKKFSFEEMSKFTEPESLTFLWVTENEFILRLSN